jgi:hypothetical protein
VRATEPLGVGGIFSQSLRLYFGSFGGFTALGVIVFVAVGVIGVLAIVGLVGLVAGLGMTDDDALMGTALLIFLGALAVGLGAWSLLQAFVIAGVSQRLRGKPLRIGRCISFGLRRFGAALWTTALVVGAVLAMLLFAVCGMSVLVGLVSSAMDGNPIVILVGAMLTFVAALPALAIACSMWVAVPVSVAEKRSGTVAMRRASWLSKGYRWGILVILIVQGALDTALRLVGNVLIAISGDPALAILAGVVVIAIWMMFITWAAIASGVGYHRLRFLKEGAEVEEVAKVFD